MFYPYIIVKYKLITLKIEFNIFSILNYYIKYDA